MSRFYTPYVIDTNAKGKEQEYHLGSRLLKDRIVVVSGEVNEDMAYIVTGQLMHLDSLNNNPITMWINSPGGSVIDKRVDKTSAEGSISQISVGQGVKAYVMRIKKEWYDEDQLAKQRYINEVEAATKAKALDGNYGNLEISRG